MINNGAFADSGYEGVFETIKTPMLDKEGKVMGVLGVARDITKRKNLETLQDSDLGIWQY